MAVLCLRQTPAPAVGSAAMADRVKQEFQHAWSHYRQLAWGHDELQPVSATPRDWYADTPLYMTPIDALDTMLLMGMQADAEQTRVYLDEHLLFDKDISVQVFEITIRILGGLISSYQLTGDAQLLSKAEDLAHRMLPAFKSPTGMPYRFVNLKTGAVRDPVSNSAEVGTLILEFGALSKLTKNPVYYDTAKRALTELYRRRSSIGLVGENINVETGEWGSSDSHVGGGIDSYYEYLLKCDRLFGDSDCAAMWRSSIAAINAHVADDVDGRLWYGVVNMQTGARTHTTYGSLEAFFPAALALGGDLTRARRLQESSVAMWQLHHVEPEELDYRTMTVTSPGYQLRPEIVESAYYLYHYTKDPKYVEIGKMMFEDLVRCCRVENGYTSLKSVITKEKDDRMHSFLLAETFKYFYLLFAPDALDFDAVTFNTEAHPIRKTW